MNKIYNSLEIKYKIKILQLILKLSRDFLLYTKKKTSCVLFYDKIWLLLALS